MRKAFITATAMTLILGMSAAIADPNDGPPPGPDPNGYYSQYDHDGYYDRNGNYVRSPRYDRDNDDGNYGPPPRNYHEGDYEQNCKRNTNAAGTLFGAIAGGLIGGAASSGHHHGADAGAVVGGVILGGLLGNALTRDVPCEDHPYAMRVYADGLNGNLGQRYDWRHDDDYGYFVPEREFRREGRVCRTFSETSYAHGHNYTRSGTACRWNDGHWRFD
jgi:surface antigen